MKWHEDSFNPTGYEWIQLVGGPYDGKCVKVHICKQEFEIPSLGPVGRMLVYRRRHSGDDRMFCEFLEMQSWKDGPAAEFESWKHFIWLNARQLDAEWEELKRREDKR